MEHSPRLLLNAQRLRRLKRDRERQTPRWNNFESRVKTAPDSPERGFELALYFAITGDHARGEQAATWAQAHPCELRQVALITDWVGLPLPAVTKNCQNRGESDLESLRDSAFLAIASGDKPQPAPAFLPAAEKISFDNSEALYAAVEYLDAVRSSTRRDLREDARTFFINLPYRFLLAFSPEQLAHPGWRTHAAALALVSLDPNMEGSQFLQSWAMEDSQTVQNGPGVAYELVWANPYLPGVGFRNMEPDLYDEGQSRLIARTGWDDDACRIEIAPGKVTDHHCPADWQTKPITFGNLTLIPVVDRCVDLTSRPLNANVILWHLQPGEKLTYSESSRQQSRNADRAGMWRVSAEIRGKVCAAK